MSSEKRIEDSKKHFALIGKRLDYSFSKKFFNEKIKDEKLSASFENIELENLNNLKETITSKNISGFNVTIPFKEKIIPLLDELSAEAKKIQAVNCVEITADKKWIGHNTDVIGFEKSLINFITDESPQALVFGSGGASKAIQYVLNKLKIEFQIVSRKKSNGNFQYQELNKAILTNHHLLINTTPLGTHPNIKDCIDIPYEFISSNHYCYDLVYNPDKSEFLNQGETRGAQIKNGLEMLEIQAEEIWKIWKSQTGN